MTSIDYSKYKNFNQNELSCRHCNAHGIKEETVAMLQLLRNLCGFPLLIHSGYRCKEHPVESKKTIMVEHVTGLAVDVWTPNADQAITILECAIKLGVRRIGVNQKGSQHSRFIHLGLSKIHPTPAMWTY